MCLKKQRENGIPTHSISTYYIRLYKITYKIIINVTFWVSTVINEFSIQRQGNGADRKKSGMKLGTDILLMPLESKRYKNMMKGRLGTTQYLLFL